MRAVLACPDRTRKRRGRARQQPDRVYYSRAYRPGSEREDTVETPERTLGFLLHDVARLLRKRFEQNARDLGLTRAQWQVLAHLARNEGIHQGGLADILELEPISLGRILDRLQSAGLVERRPHPKDRRVWLLFLRPKAHPVIERMRAIGAATRAEALAGVPESEREQLLHILTVMKENLIAASSSANGERIVRHG
jgi:MarR family transcriptional regulator for hemolysin